MRFLYARLVGYVGLYSGLGLKEIDIDFSKARNKICVISGPNGVGKSTIINALNLMPDDNSCFIPSMEASKYLKLTDGMNIYDITMVHGINSHNERTTTKVSILKNGVELNPNGNVRSYKEIIQNEFELDSNYTVLSKIGGNDRGIADKTPAERKKIVSSIISSLEVYNNIYKVLNKKANTLKSFINNLGYKIQNIGTEEALHSTLISIKSRTDALTKAIEETKESLTKSKTIIAMVDPDGSVQKRLDELNEQIKPLKNQIIELEVKIQKTNCDKSVEDLQEAVKMAESEQTKLLMEISSISENITAVKTDIDQLQNKINKETNEIDPNLESQLQTTKDRLTELQNLFSGINIDDVSKDEIDFVIKFSNDLVYKIDTLKADQNITIVSEACEWMMGNQSIHDCHHELQSQIDQYNQEIENTQTILQTINNDIAQSQSIDQRPDQCNIDSCPFISEALSIIHRYGDRKSMLKKKDSTENQISELKKSLQEVTNQLNHIEMVENMILKIQAMNDSISMNSSILSKFPATKRLTNCELFLTDLKNQYMFTEIRSMEQYQDMSNSIIEYKSLSKILSNLEAEYKVQSNTEKLIRQYQNELSEKKHKLESLYDHFDKKRKEKQFNDNLLEGLNNQLQTALQLESDKQKLIEKQNQVSNIESEISTITSKLQSSANEIHNINLMMDRYNKLTTEVKPLEENRRQVESRLDMLRSFQQEYAQYKDQYNLIDTLRKYSSPTSGGIQSLFMSIYMDKTLDTVNQLLGMIFHGQYQILQYIINEDEFRIPFVGNGLVVDDISNGSTSQVCIMGMIINLVLFTSGSNKYNIVSLDEIDGGLDHENRYLFVNILQQICDILNIDQLFIISHSVESALQSVDVVLLSDQEYYVDQFAAANIIWQYKN